jgi:F-type H+-transporting ATPase subunit epsilon
LEFNLKIVTPFGVFFEGAVSKLLVKTSEGYVEILPRHIPLVAPVEISGLYFTHNNVKEQCAISGGVLYVSKEVTRIALSSCEYKRDINIKRAREAKERAEQRLKAVQAGIDTQRAEAALLRAINRINIADK